jgi:predicted phage gp36 major capsid-like protein
MDYDIDTSAPETKAGFASADRDAHDELMRTHDEFKAANDERLAALERRRGDVLLEEKVDRISDAIDLRLKRIEDYALKQARPPACAGGCHR